MNNEKLKSVADALTALAGTITDLIEEPAKQEPEKPKITLQQIRGKLADYSQAGYTAEIREILKKFGAKKLSEVKPENYEAILAEAEKLNG